MPSRKWKPLYYTCGRCKHQVSEGAVNAHLAQCQPKGVECGKCKKLITDPDFVGHYKSCEGKPKEELLPEPKYKVCLKNRQPEPSEESKPAIGEDAKG